MVVDAAAALAAASRVARDVGAVRAISSGSALVELAEAEFAGAELLPRTSNPGTESAELEAAEEPLPPFASGPTENFAGRAVSGRGAVNFVAGFSPTTATSTCEEGILAASRVGASCTSGAAAFPFEPGPLTPGDGGGTNARGLGLFASADA